MDIQQMKDLSRRCAVCGCTYGMHGYTDERCPGKKEGGEWVAAETFFEDAAKAVPRGGKEND
jgi:hypothetical protein